MVYILVSCEESLTEDVSILGVFDRPKTARKWVDAHYGGNSKNKWTREYDDVRSYLPPNGTFRMQLIEARVLTDV